MTLVSQTINVTPETDMEYTRPNGLFKGRAVSVVNKSPSQTFEIRVFCQNEPERNTAQYKLFPGLYTIEFEGPEISVGLCCISIAFWVWTNQWPYRIIMAQVGFKDEKRTYCTQGIV